MRLFNFGSLKTLLNKREKNIKKAVLGCGNQYPESEGFPCMSKDECMSLMNAFFGQKENQISQREYAHSPDLIVNHCGGCSFKCQISRASKTGEIPYRLSTAV